MHCPKTARTTTSRHDERCRRGTELAHRAAYRHWAERGCRADVDELVEIALFAAASALRETPSDWGRDGGDEGDRLERVVADVLASDARAHGERGRP